MKGVDAHWRHNLSDLTARHKERYPGQNRPSRLYTFYSRNSISYWSASMLCTAEAAWMFPALILVGSPDRQSFRREVDVIRRQMGYPLKVLACDLFIAVHDWLVAALHSLLISELSQARVSD
jgi:hypothetical protein